MVRIRCACALWSEFIAQCGYTDRSKTVIEAEVQCRFEVGQNILWLISNDRALRGGDNAAVMQQANLTAT